MVRVKYRFIIAQLLPVSANLKEKIHSHRIRELQQAIKDKIQELYGDIGSGEIGQVTSVKYFENLYTHIFVVKTLRELESRVEFALSCINRLDQQNLVIRTIVSQGCERTTSMRVKQTLINALQSLVVPENEKATVVESIIRSVDGTTLV